MIYIDDNVVNIPTQIGKVSYKSAIVYEGQNVVLLKTQFGNIVVAPSAIKEGDNVIVLPTQVGNVILKQEEDTFCPYIGEATPRSGAFTLSKIIRNAPENPRRRWISQTNIQITYNPSWQIWGDLLIKIDGTELWSISGANGEEYSLWDYDFEMSEEGTLVELIFSGSYCGMVGAKTQVGYVFACLVTL